MTPPRALVLRPPAKINLMLRIGPRRADGFHDLRTLFQSIAICDRLTLEPQRGPLTLEVTPAVAPADRTNLVWRAADALWRALGRRGEPHGVRMRLEKHIPVAAGLGGGSADAAAALSGLHAIWKGRLSRADLLRTAAELGSDVPFFFVGGTAIGLGRGEDLYPLADLRAGVVVIKPRVDVSTAEAFRWLDDDRARPGEAAAPVSSIDLGWPSGPLQLVNDMQGPVGRRHGVVGEAMAALSKAGARAVLMSGSGSAVFGVWPTAPSAAACRRLQSSQWTVLSTRTLTRREASRRMRL